MERLGARHFLNRVGFHGDASISYAFTQNPNGSIVGTLSVRDCHRGITISLDVGTEEDYQNSKEKLSKIWDIARLALLDLKRARDEFMESQRAIGREPR